MFPIVAWLLEADAESLNKVFSIVFWLETAIQAIVHQRLAVGVVANPSTIVLTSYPRTSMECLAGEDFGAAVGSLLSACASEVVRYAVELSFLKELLTVGASRNDAVSSRATGAAVFLCFLVVGDN
ncbi:hypothetical protein ACH5RR_018921 [Cinchona calisaya]|uniref:Uncharacterized protein n=1 Tax=Cinchona calisaya TaxID=153742 RepID=A0ABD2ZRH1_9GENT